MIKLLLEAYASIHDQQKKYHNYHSSKSDFAYCKPFQQEETPDKSEDG